MLYVYYASICYNRKFRWTIEESVRMKVCKIGRCIRITFLDSLSSIFLDLPRGTRPRLGILFYFISPPAPSLYNRSGWKRGSRRSIVAERRDTGSKSRVVDGASVNNLGRERYEASADYRGR